MSKSDRWPIEREEIGFTDGEIKCPCGETFRLWWNGGELDEHMCLCGRFYETQHRETVLIVRKAPVEEAISALSGRIVVGKPDGTVFSFQVGQDRYLGEPL